METHELDPYCDRGCHVAVLGASSQIKQRSSSKARSGDPDLDNQRRDVGGSFVC
jgi:hypothetical protein